MKLYTEEQLRKAYKDGNLDGFSNVSALDMCIDSLTPIELPSDDDIREASKNMDRPGLFWENEFARDSFVQCGKWLKEQILNQNK